jgi:tRNA 2-thiouridine synthesizing protein D
MTRFGVLITSNSYSCQTLSSVLNFTTAAIKAGHVIDHIFLYQDAVYSIAADMDLPSDEPNVSVLLAQFCHQHDIALLYCITAAEKRGVVAAKRPAITGFVAAGLAEFAMRQAQIDKLVQF